jgi:ferrochelatase
MTAPIGVLIMAYGTPTTRDDVEAYYTRIRHGRAPTPELLADLVRRYDAIGGTSPLAHRTADQVRGIADVLDDVAPGQFDVRFGSKYEPPLLEATAESFLHDGFTSVIGVALAPHSSSMSTDQYMDRARAALGPDVAFSAIGAWWEAPGFLELIARRVREALDTVPVERLDTTEVLFSAHSLPEKILASGDTYPDQLRDSAERAAALAGVGRWDVAWQSAGRTADPWIGPDILAVLRQKRVDGVSDVVSCPIGFVADHLEVLFDIDVEAMGVAHEVGLNLVRTRSLNADPEFVAVLANVIRTAAA